MRELMAMDQAVMPDFKLFNNGTTAVPLSEMTLRYFDRVQPSSRWEVVLYVDERADDDQCAALTAIFLGRAGGTVAAQYGRAIGDVHAVRRLVVVDVHGAVHGEGAIGCRILPALELLPSVPRLANVECGRRQATRHHVRA